MKHLTSLLLAAAVCFPLAAKHDSAFLNTVSNDYVTPHYKFQNKKEKPLKPLFILMRSGARDGVEVYQRMPMDITYFLVEGPWRFALEDMYESTHEGLSIYEKERELSRTLAKDYDFYVIGQMDFRKLPESGQYQILNDVRNGKTLIVVHMQGIGKLPYKKLYQKPISLPRELRSFAKPSRRVLMQAYEMGKGKIIHLAWNMGSGIQDRSLLPLMPYSNKWKAQNENSAAFFALLCRYAAGKDLKPTNPVIRIRDAWNKDVTNEKNLPGGTYYRDIIGDNGAFFIEEFKKTSPVGKVTITLPETADKTKPLNGSARFDIPPKENMIATVELYDSPHARIWYRETVKVPAGAEKFDFTLKNFYMPNIAAYVRLTFRGEDGTPKAIEDQVVFFPDSRVDDYFQMGWNGPSATTGELLAPLMTDRMGWNLVLSHPTARGDNARSFALLNSKMVPYLVRITHLKGEDGGIKGLWAWYPNEVKAMAKAIEGDESIYRPEVQNVWRAVVKYRMENLPKYGIPFYNLGDENGFSYEAGYGKSDLKYFRKFLAERYGTIKNYNYNHKTNYKSFDEVPHHPLAEAKNSGKYAAWRDHRAYMEKVYADTHAFLRDEIRKYDPNAKVGAEGSVPGELELTMGPLEVWGPYSELIGDELLRSLGREKIRSLWWGGYPGSHGGRPDFVGPLNKDLLLGSVNGNAWFACNPGYNHSSFSVDFTVAKYVRKYMPELDRLKDGVAQLLIRNPMENTGIAIFWSHASSEATYLDKNFHAPQDGIAPLIYAAYRTGYGFEFVTERTIDRLKNTKLLFLCGASALSQKECSAILDYVKNGGVVVADINPALLNEKLRKYEKNPLQALFGNITTGNAKAAEFKPLNLPGFKAARVPQTGEVFKVRKYGKGTAILCNFSLASAANTATPAGSFDNWLLGIMKQYGAAPTFTVKNAEETTMVRVRHNDEFSLIGVMQPIHLMSKSVEVDLNGDYHVYEAAGKYLGKKNKLNIAFKNSPLQLFSIFKTPQTAPKFSVANAVRGERVKIALPAMKTGRVYRLEMMDPNGKEVYQAVFDRKEIAPDCAIAYTEKTGKWSMKLTDIATGLSTTTTFEVK